jgi:hypothetical protein
MSSQPPRLPGHSGARHSEEWYRGGLGDTSLRSGDRMFIRCEGGPCISRLEIFPPQMEIQEEGGLYVLVDDGPLEEWMYQFVPAVDR